MPGEDTDVVVKDLSKAAKVTILLLSTCLSKVGANNLELSIHAQDFFIVTGSGVALSVDNTMIKVQWLAMLETTYAHEVHQVVSVV